MTLISDITYDVFIIGGGISGAAIAAECAQRGLRVGVCGRGDVGGASSSHSDQILPGAYHFLKNHNLPYFNKALKEKALLKKRAPHLCTESTFIAPSNPDAFQKLKNQFWLWVYRKWLLHTNNMNIPSSVSPGQLDPLSKKPNHTWIFQEQMVNDSRLVVENLICAQQHNGLIMPRSTCVSAHRHNGLWQVTLEFQDGSHIELKTKALINAAGPWVNRVQKDLLNIETRCWVELKRKCFLIVPRFYSGRQAYIMENGSQQFTVSPFQQHYCLVSLTDIAENDQNQNHMNDDECLMMLDRLNSYFNTQLSADSIIQSFATQQPLYCDDNHAQQNSVDDYALDMDCSDGHSPVVSVFGGSFATHRTMALEVIQLLSAYLSFPRHVDMHRVTPLPGGEIGEISFDQFILNIAEQYPWLPSHLLHHYCRTYGARSAVLLAGCRSLSDLGEELSPGLREQEARFLCDHEWATSGDDILWRRTQLGLNASETDHEHLNKWVKQYLLSQKRQQQVTIDQQHPRNSAL